MQTELERLCAQVRQYEDLVLRLYPYVTFPADNPTVKPIARDLEATIQQIPFNLVAP